MPYLTKSEAPKILGITPAAVRQAADKGRLKVSAVTESGIRLFLKKDVTAFHKKRLAQHAKGRSEDNSGLAV